jgi:hypothetical protein
VPRLLRDHALGLGELRPRVAARLQHHLERRNATGQPLSNPRPVVEVLLEHDDHGAALVVERGADGRLL